MKKTYKNFLAVMAVLFLLIVPISGMTYTINDSPANDAIGYPTYETYGANFINWTPGVNSGPIGIQLFTNMPPTGHTIGSWFTPVADLFITENYNGVDYNWAVPIVAHDGFTPGSMYAVGSYLTSTDVYNSIGGGSYNYNPNVPVLLSTVGENYGFAGIGGGSVTFGNIGSGLPDYRYDVQLGIWEDDPFATFTLVWGTATCGNDILSGQVGGGGIAPIPGTLLMLGSGLLGILGLRTRMK